VVKMILFLEMDVEYLTYAQTQAVVEKM